MSYKLWVWGIIIAIIVGNLMRFGRGYQGVLGGILFISIGLLIAISLSVMVESLKRIKNYLKGG